MTLDNSEMLPEHAPSGMAKQAREATWFLKTLAHEGRLMILCHLGTGEKSVGQLEELLGLRQASVSQMLARLREEGQVATRRDGKTIYYRIARQDTAQLIKFLHNMFCGPDDKRS